MKAKITVKQRMCMMIAQLLSEVAKLPDADEDVVCSMPEKSYAKDYYDFLRADIASSTLYTRKLTKILEEEYEAENTDSKC